jgi:hypothetical protein
MPCVNTSACLVYGISRQTPHPLGSALKGSVRSMAENPGSFEDHPEYNTGGKKQHCKKQDQTSAHNVLESHVHGIISLVARQP